MGELLQAGCFYIDLQLRGTNPGDLLSIMKASGVILAVG